MAFRNLRAIIGPLELPIDDKTYTVPPVPAEWGVRFRIVAEGGDDADVAGMTGDSQLELFLGDALVEMRKDGVPQEYVDLALLTAIAEFNFGRPAAERTWEAGPNPNLMAALRAASQERMSSSPDSPPSPSTAKVAKTPTAGSSSTTSPPATPRPARKRPAKASAGRKSSSTARS